MGRQGDNLKRNLARELERRAQNTQARPARPKPVEVQHVDDFDATPERLAMEPDAQFEEVKHDGFGRRIGKARRFTSSHLDRFKNNDRINLRQWMAGDWYRNQHERCGFGLSVIAAYGERLGGGEAACGLARTEAQAQARQVWRAARSAWPANMVGYMERLLIHDEMPRAGWRANARSLKDMALALDCLADWLERYRTKPAQTVNISLAQCGAFDVSGTP